MENTEYLRTIFIFRELTGIELIQFNKVLRTAKAAKGDVVIREGDPADKMYIIKKGAVDIYKGDGMAKTKVTHLLPGAHFGEVALIDDSRRSATVVALEDCDLLVIDRRDFNELLEQNKDIAFKIYKAFTRALCDRLRQANENLIVAHHLKA
jgi:CRP-like cAMP-binding protein